jgi:hypothetical protein
VNKGGLKGTTLYYSKTKSSRKNEESDPDVFRAQEELTFLQKLEQNQKN